MRQVRYAVILLLAALSCRSGISRDIGTAETELRADYADLFSVLGPDDLERWVRVRTTLRTALDHACANEACGGYSNLTTVQIVCSASLGRHTMRECAWIVGGSTDAIDGTTGEHLGEPRAITCSLPLKLTTSAFLDTLASAGEGALDAPLPGTGHSLHEAVLGCLDGTDAGTVPPSVPSSAFVALDELLPAGTKDGDAWQDIGRRLQSSFDEACGDTFCEGDYGDIRALRLACAADRRTAVVHGCTWSLAMTTADVSADGTIHPLTAARACPIAIDAPASALLVALATNDPLRAPLPGRTTSLNDALAGCL